MYGQIRELNYKRMKTVRETTLNHYLKNIKQKVAADVKKEESKKISKKGGRRHADAKSHKSQASSVVSGWTRDDDFDLLDDINNFKNSQNSYQQSAPRESGV